MDLPERLRAKIEVDSAGCWLWTAALDGSGYGKVWVGRSCKAHRLVWGMIRGQIPAGLTLDHLCRVRRCVNPSHLEVVTMRVNVLRGEGVTARHAAKTVCPRGHEYTVGRRQRLCLTCRRARSASDQRVARARNLEKFRARDREWQRVAYAKDPAKFIARVTRYRATRKGVAGAAA